MNLRAKRHYHFPAMTFVFVLCLTGCVQQASLSAEKIPVDETSDFHGKVTDAANKPIGHVKIRLTDKLTGKVKSTTTNRDGQFWISTASPNKLAIAFIPPEKSGLACALFDSLPAREDRQLFVHLVRGFPVTGRVTFAGTPLKGLVVKACALKPDNEHERIYGSGQAITSASGKFHMVLAPGRKRLIVENALYTNVEAKASRPIVVTSDLQLGDITMSSAGLQ